MVLPVCPKNVLVRENLVSQEDYPARQLCSVQETAHHVGTPPVQILKISHFKKKATFVETKENTVFLRKIKKNLNCL